MSKNILITGSGGLIGSEAVNFYCEKGFNVIGVDNNMRAYYFGEEGSTKDIVSEHITLYENYKHFETDIRDKQKIEDIFKQFKFDLIIHTAAQPSHDWAAKEPLTDFSVNADATLILLENFRKYSPEGVFIFTSTNKVYGDTPNSLPLIEQKTRFEIDPDHKYKNGITEDMSIDNSTHSLFGVSKTAADLMVQEYGRYFNLKTGIFRGGCLTGSKHAGVQQHGFLSYLVRCIITGRKYTIFGYKGKQVRDNIHAYDLINVFDEFYQRPKIGEVYNMGGSRFANVSILEAIEKIEDISGKKAKIEYKDQNRTGDHIWYVSSVEKFKSHYPDWNYKYNIDATIEDICRNSSFSKNIFSYNVIKSLDYWKGKNWYFHSLLKQIFKELVPEKKSVLQVGYGLGDILGSLFPKKGVSIDTDESIVPISQQRYPYFSFINVNPAKINIEDKFDYVVFPNSVDHLDDIQTVLEKIKNNLTSKGEIVITSINPRWEQLWAILEKLNLKRKERPKNWLRLEDLKNITEISGYKVINAGFRILLPVYIPLISNWINKVIPKVKLLSRFCLEQFIIIQKQPLKINKNLTCSVIIPAFNQRDYLQRCIEEVYKISRKMEVIVVNNGSTDTTETLVKNLTKNYKNLKLINLNKTYSNKIATKRGLDEAKGDMLMVLDAGLSISAYELARFFNLLSAEEAGFINGTRLIYPTKAQRLRQLNLIGNLLFSLIFSWLMKQRVTDTLSNAKAFYRKDYRKIKTTIGTPMNFDLLFGAAENKLRIIEQPIHFKGKLKSNSGLETIINLLLLTQMILWGFLRLRVLSILR